MADSLVASFSSERPAIYPVHFRPAEVSTADPIPRRGDGRYFFEVTTDHIHPAILEMAGGEVNRIEVLPDGECVIHNSPALRRAAIRRKTR